MPVQPSIKLINVNTSHSSKSINLNLEGASFAKTGEMEILKAKNLTDFNTVADPFLISPLTVQINLSGKKLPVNLDPSSVNVIILKMK
jgi:alpha-L-arabinofuranosidase